MKTPFLDGLRRKVASDMFGSDMIPTPDYGIIVVTKNSKSGEIINVGRVRYPVARLDRQDPTYEEISKEDVIRDLKNGKRYITIFPSANHIPKDGAFVRPVKDKYIRTVPDDIEEDNLGELCYLPFYAD